jgi:hypothetical protein
MGSILMACCKVAEIGSRGRKMTGRKKERGKPSSRSRGQHPTSVQNLMSAMMDFEVSDSESLFAESGSGIILDIAMAM